MNAGLDLDKETIDCFSDQILQDFKSGKLSDLALKVQVSSHVESCRNCESRLSTLQRQESGATQLEPLPSLSNSAPESPRLFQSSTQSRLNTSAARAETRQDSSSLESLPAKIDRYLILRELGTGGFAQVFLAKDTDHNRLVAIKIPRPDRLITRESRDAFLNEARTVALMEHPNVVPLYDYRELEDGRCIVVMKYVEGSSLKQVMKSERIGPARSAKLVSLIADALHYAHQRGIWHRDVKPANILLDAKGKPYLADFGLAIHEDRQHLHVNELAGTYPYMSPEQIRGAADQLDGRSDIWSLGVVFYELLTRNRPFQAAAMDQLRDEITQRPHRALTSYDSKVPIKLARICDRCLRKNADERYETAAQLAADARSYLSRPWNRVIGFGLAASCLVLVALSISQKLGPREVEENVQPQADAAGLANVAPVEIKAQPNAPQAVERKLIPLAWGTTQQSDFYKILEPNGRVAVKSIATVACFETHQPGSKHYRIRISADLQNQTAQAGIVLGVHKTSVDPEEFRCYVALVGRDVTKNQTWMTIEDCKIGMNEFRHRDLRERRQIARVLLEEELAERVRLEIEIDSEKIASIKYDDQPLVDGVEGLKSVNVPKKTGCGIVVLGHVVFHSIQCEELTQ